MSRNGTCSNNAPVERFFRSLKNELRISSLSPFVLPGLSTRGFFFRVLPRAVERGEGCVGIVAIGRVQRIVGVVLVGWIEWIVGNIAIRWIDRLRSIALLGGDSSNGIFFLIIFRYIDIVLSFS